MSFAVLANAKNPRKALASRGSTFSDRHDQAFTQAVTRQSGTFCNRSIYRIGDNLGLEQFADAFLRVLQVSPRVIVEFHALRPEHEGDLLVEISQVHAHQGARVFWNAATAAASK